MGLTIAILETQMISSKTDPLLTLHDPFIDPLKQTPLMIRPNNDLSHTTQPQSTGPTCSINHLYLQPSEEKTFLIVKNILQNLELQQHFKYQYLCFISELNLDFTLLKGL